jgi:transglutaminase-like putative cysteine protease
MPRRPAFPDPADALGATDVIEADDPRIRETADRIAGDTSGTEALKRLFEWVRDEVKYEMSPEVHSRADWRSTGTLERGYGFCQQKAVLLAALLRARGIPAGIVAQDVLDRKIPPHYVEFIGHQILEGHGLNCVHVDGEWVLVDATLPARLCERKRYRLVRYDGTGDAVLPATDLDGEPHFQILEELGVWADMPDEIVERTIGLDYLHSPEYKKMARRHGPGM